MRYFEGENIKPRYASDARLLIGKRVKWLRSSDIDKSGRGYYFPRYGTVDDVHGRNVSIDGCWYAFSGFVEMVEMAA